MGKYSNTVNNKSLRKKKIPLNLLLLFGNKKIKDFIRAKFKNKNDQYLTLYISKKYAKMIILELYRRYKNYLKKDFPNIIKTKRNKSCIKLPKQNLNYVSIKKENINHKNEDYFCKNIYKGEDLREEISNINKRNCSHIPHLFEPYKFTPNICEKYDNCFIKSIDCRKNELYSPIYNKKDNLSTESSLYSSSNKNNNNKTNKIYFVTYFPNKVHKKHNLFNVYHL